MKKFINFKLLPNTSCKNVKMWSPFKGYNCPSNGGLITLHYVVIFNGESQLECLYGVTKVRGDRFSLNSNLFQNPYITENLFGILKVIVQEPSTWYPK